MRATRLLPVPVYQLTAGAFDPGALAGPRPTLSMLVVEGLLSRRRELGGRTSMQLLAATDLFSPAPCREAVLPVSRATWRSYGDARVAVLDDRVALAARRWPEILMTLQERLHRQIDDAATGLAIQALPRVEHRLLALLWHVAGKAGRVGPDSVSIDVHLTHRSLGELIGAQRSTVTLAAQLLAETGLAWRTGGSWHLSHHSVEALTPGGRPLPRRVHPQPQDATVRPVTVMHGRAPRDVADDARVAS